MCKIIHKVSVPWKRNNPKNTLKAQLSLQRGRKVNVHLWRKTSKDQPQHTGSVTLHWRFSTNASDERATLLWIFTVICFHSASKIVLLLKGVANSQILSLQCQAVFSVAFWRWKKQWRLLGNIRKLGTDASGWRCGLFPHVTHLSEKHIFCVHWEMMWSIWSRECGQYFPFLHWHPWQWQWILFQTRKFWVFGLIKTLIKLSFRRRNHLKVALKLGHSSWNE